MGTSIPNYNVSEKYKTIWLAPERTGSRKVSEILTFYDFKRNNSPVFNFGNYNFSHVMPTDSRYLDYVIPGIHTPEFILCLKTSIVNLMKKIKVISRSI